MTDNKTQADHTASQDQPEPQANKDSLKEPMASKAPAAGEQTAEASPSRSSAGKVLLIEDDPPMVKMYSTKLKKEGFEVEVAFDGEEGLAKFREWVPDLVVLDLMIPKIGGMEVLGQLRATPKGKSLPVVILSNLSQEQDIQRAKELGVEEFLIKANFTPGQVVEKIKSYIRKS